MLTPTFSLKPSLYLSILILVTHVSAVGVIFILSWSLWAKLGGISFILVGLLYGLWKTWGPARIMGLHHQEDLIWTLETATGKNGCVELQGNSFVSPWLMVLGFVSVESRKRIFVTIFSDACSHASHFRQLCVIVRLTSFH